MKIWYGYGSEHSANLVMIGEFRTVRDAAMAKQMIDGILHQLNVDVEAGLLQIGDQTDRFTDGMKGFLWGANFYSLIPAEVEQFGYHVTVEIDDRKVIVKTDEIDVSAFLKVLLHHGARVDVYSAHNYPDTGYGRGAQA